MLHCQDDYIAIGQTDTVLPYQNFGGAAAPRFLRLCLQHECARLKELLLPKTLNGIMVCIIQLM